MIGKVYQNANENVDRETFQSVHQLVMIHPVYEIDIIQELKKIKNWYNLSIKFCHKKWGSVMLLYNIPTIQWMGKIYCSVF